MVRRFKALTEHPIASQLGRVCEACGITPSQYLKSGATLADLHLDAAVLLAHRKQRLEERAESLKEFLSQNRTRDPQAATAAILQWLGIMSS